MNDEFGGESETPRNEFKDIVQKEPGGSLIRNPTAAASKTNPGSAESDRLLRNMEVEKHLERSVKVCTCTGECPDNDSGSSGRRVAVQRLSSFTRSLPCSVPEKYQLNQGVCEMNQAVLGYAGDPQPVVQNVQVHAVGGVGFFFFSSCRPTRISATLVNVTQLGRSDEEHERLGRTASRCDHLAGRGKKHPTDAIWIQPIRTTVYSNKRASPPDDTPPALKGAAAI